MALLMAVVFMITGCNPEYLEKSADRIEYQLTDESSPFQQGVETTALVTDQVQQTMKLVPFIPYAKEASVGLGLFSIILNAAQALRGKKLRTAVTEIVQGAEAFKENVPPDSADTFKQKQAEAQSASTKVLVAEIKAAL